MHLSRRVGPTPPTDQPPYLADRLGPPIAYIANKGKDSWSHPVAVRANKIPKHTFAVRRLAEDRREEERGSHVEGACSLAFPSTCTEAQVPVHHLASAWHLGAEPLGEPLLRLESHHVCVDRTEDLGGPPVLVAKRRQS